MPPIYPIFIWLVNIFNNQLLFLRIFGIFFGYILYSQSSLLIKNGTLIFIDTKKKFAKILSNIISIFLIIFVCNISNYLLWYDFTILVLIFQISIVNLIFNLINRNNFYDSKFNYYQAISFLNNRSIIKT